MDQIYDNTIKYIFAKATKYAFAKDAIVTGSHHSQQTATCDFTCSVSEFMSSCVYREITSFSCDFHVTPTSETVPVLTRVKLV